MQFFSSDKCLEEIFFKITHPLPQELKSNGRPLMRSFKLLINKKINMKEKDKRNEFLMSRWILNSSFDSTQAKVTRKKKEYLDAQNIISMAVLY